MADDAKNRGIYDADHHHNQPYYGTFQGVANYYPPHNPPPHAVVGFPQPLPPSQPPPVSYDAPRYYYQGYHSLPVYAVADGRPLREHRLPCCGLGLGWLLFLTGFILGGVPWYIGTFILLCIQMDYREKPGLIACTVASFIAVIAVTFGVTQQDHDWLSFT
ncbi:hypothetical protein Lal_00037447 [Lupinus albus]|uniref:Uncharacterized protein n=1 Tax=Lupinus albus TaxID=3870 RepID=A0A6A5P0V1_LUPAL|nr:hypothetical protein Lalb_Chr18g0055571 [Lupinus albus]KAF1890876.1 hypothetical protein Lal_00037447 [Lupinus albus]